MEGKQWGCRLRIEPVPSTRGLLKRLRTQYEGVKVEFEQIDGELFAEFNPGTPYPSLPPSPQFLIWVAWLSIGLEEVQGVKKAKLYAPRRKTSDPRFGPKPRGPRGPNVPW